MYETINWFNKLRIKNEHCNTRNKMVKFSVDQSFKDNNKENV